MKIIDAHCDVLYKLWENNYSFYSSQELQVNYQKWKANKVKVQCFAIFVPEYVPQENQFQVALDMVNIFFEQIIEPYEDIKFISNKQDLIHLKEGERGAILTLEGCHPIGDDLTKLKTLIRLGVRAVGLTWNQANAVSDGIGEKRGAGLSSFGEEVVQLLNREKIWTDVSHLSYQGFFDVMNLAEFPMASHSNAKALADHRRNLDDKQIKALIKRNGWIGVVFVPFFLVKDQLQATDDEVVNHINYMLSLGAENCLGFGSDFDGDDHLVKGINDYSDYDDFVSKLISYVTSDQLRKICYQNFVDKFPN